ncbi:WAP four-disulfide core domain protein 1-like [Ptychodera flava]|uniref:WAP four-disulfide core domain protein 1-like n=1 Tax=Ptychodera flava TaxID=63121 RepID=UPI00396A7984
MDWCRIVSLLVLALAVCETVAGRALNNDSPLSRLLEPHRLGAQSERRSRGHTSQHHHHHHHDHHKHHERGRCPPSPEKFPEDACQKTACSAASDCSGDTVCCFNGCMYTCMTAMMPPLVVDWIKEPPRQNIFGYSLLINGPEEPFSEELCSTTVFKDGTMEPGCPTGFVCHIEDEGDPKHGIPNRGICVQQH